MDRRATDRRGFTIVELMIGMTITALVLGAAAGFAVALSASWQSAEDAGRQQVASAAGTTRLKRLLQPARYVGTVGVGSAEPGDAPAEAFAVIWRADDFAAPDLGGGLPPVRAGDGVIQYGEVSVVSFAPGGGSLMLYEPLDAREMSRDQLRQAANRLGRQTLDDPATYRQFKQLVDSRQLIMMADPAPLLGSADPDGRGLKVRAVGLTRDGDPDGGGGGGALSYWVELDGSSGLGETSADGSGGAGGRVVRGTVGLWHPSAPADDSVAYKR